MGLVLYCMQAMIFTLILAGLFLILHFFSFSSYLINSVVYPLIDKTMIQPYQKKVEENEENMEEADQLISDKND